MEKIDSLDKHLRETTITKIHPLPRLVKEEVSWPTWILV